MRTRIFFFLSVCSTIGCLSAQDYFPHHNFTFGVGAARPRGDLGSLLKDSPAISFGYGYRFHRYFQADAGFDMAFGAANVRDYLDTALGPLRIKDREYFIPLGGRAIAPLLGGRLLFSGPSPPGGPAAGGRLLGRPPPGRGPPPPGAAWPVF